MSKVRLFFPDIETGQASVGYSTIDIVNHVAGIDGVEAEAIAYWQQTAGATVVPGAQPVFTIDLDTNPFDSAGRGASSDSDGDELPIGAQQ